MTKNSKEEIELKEPRVYELGFWVAPLIPEEDVPSQFSSIKKLIEDHGSSFISEEMPTMKDLAYPIRKMIAGKRYKFEKGYFGWVKFETTPDQALSIRDEIARIENIFRSIVVKTLRENTVVGFKKPLRDNSEEELKPEDKVTEEVLKVDTEVVDPNKVQKEIDKEIDQLVIE